MDKTEIWNNVLYELDGLNRRIKEAGWSFSDKQEVYRMKDSIIAKLLKEKPDCVEITLYCVPYIIYSTATKDKAGALMRSDTERNSFEYYLSQVPRSADDIEDISRGNVEVITKIADKTYSFHMPNEVIESCGISVKDLPRKPWIPALEFHHKLLEEKKAVIDELLSNL